jgi:hypothetical protein
MKKLLLALILAVTPVIQAKEQKALFVTVGSGGALTSGISPKEATEYIDTWLSKGWRITHVSGSGADSIIRIFCFVLERD